MSPAYTDAVPQQVLDVSNEVAAELAGVEDGVLDALRERLGCTIALRGNRLTLGGDDEHVAAARAVVDELVELVEGGHQIGPDTVGAVLAALDQAEDVRDVFEDVVWRHRGKKIAPKTVNQKRYVDAIRARTVTFAVGPAGTGKTYLAMALAVSALSEGAVGRIILTRPAVEAGERLGFLPGDLLAKVDPYLRPLYDALYDMIDAERLVRVHGAGHDRGRAARVHARTDAQRLVHRPRRGAEHDAGADADVPDAARVRLEDGRDRRHHAGRPPARAGVRPDPGAGDPRRDRRASASSSSGTRTSCDTSSCSGSSRRTSAMPRRPARRAASR